MLPEEALGHHDVDRALADVVALDESGVGEARHRRLPHDLAGGLHLLDALYLLDADIQQADGRTLDIEDDAGERRAHDRDIDQPLVVRADGRADVEHDGFAPERRPEARDRRRSIDAMVRSRRSPSP